MRFLSEETAANITRIGTEIGQTLELTRSWAGEIEPGDATRYPATFVWHPDHQRLWAAVAHTDAYALPAQITPCDRAVITHILGLHHAPYEAELYDLLIGTILDELAGTT